MMIWLRRQRLGSRSHTRPGLLLLLSSAAHSVARRLPPAKPPHLDPAQQELYDTIVDSRIKVVGREALFDEDGGLRGPWNPEVTSPALGQHLERLATAVRTQNSLEARVYEVAILVVGVHWQAQFEWYAHERIARKAGVAEAAFPLIKANAAPDELVGILQPDELAAYKLARELMANKRVSAATYKETKEILGGDDRKMADLCMTCAPGRLNDWSCCARCPLTIARVRLSASGWAATPLCRRC